MHEPTARELKALIDERDRLYHGRIDGLVERIEQRFDAEQRALEHARREIDSRLEAMNEFRAQITAERGNFITRELFDARVQYTDERLSELDRQIQGFAGSLKILIALTVGITVALAAQIVRAFW